MVERKEVESLVREIEEGCREHSCTPHDMSLDVEGDILLALCRAWLAVDEAASVALEWGDFNRGLHIDDDRMTPYAWETHLTGQRVRIVRVGE